VIYGVAAYGLWGIFPLYFRAVSHVPTLEVLCHRIIWSAVLLLALVALRRDWPAVRQSLRSPRTLLTLCTTTLLIGGNWLGFIWAVANQQVLQASLGYFINPLVNVLLGFIFLRERLRRWQSVSVLLAGAAVTVLTVRGGQFPALALFLAVSFGTYALLRKTASVDALVGLTVETAILTPAALAYLGYQMVSGRIVFLNASPPMDLLLMLAGVITATPLLLFTKAARRLRLATLGFLQYLSPTGHFLLAVLAFGEPFSLAHGISFGCIWTALAIYSIDAATGSRGPANDKTPPPIE